MASEMHPVLLTRQFGYGMHRQGSCWSFHQTQGFCHLSHVLYGGENIASGSYDRSVRIWDVKSGRHVQGPFEGHNFVVFSSDVKRMASSSRGGSVFVWDINTGVLMPGSLQ
jgi:WD40 repeat protein